MFKRCAVAGLTIAALSHVNRVFGLGVSWSHPLLAKRPSKMEGSARNEISRSEAAAVWELVLCVFGGFAKSVRAATLIAGSAVPAITPSCSDRSQKFSNALSFSGRWPAQ